MGPAAYWSPGVPCVFHHSYGGYEFAGPRAWTWPWRRFSASLALAAWLNALEGPLRPGPFAGFFLGLTVSTKYPGGVDAAIMAFVCRLPMVEDRGPSVDGAGFRVDDGGRRGGLCALVDQERAIDGESCFTLTSTPFWREGPARKKVAMFSADIAQGASRDLLS